VGQRLLEKNLGSAALLLRVVASIGLVEYFVFGRTGSVPEGVPEVSFGLIVISLMLELDAERARELRQFVEKLVLTIAIFSVLYVLIHHFLDGAPPNTDPQTTYEMAIPAATPTEASEQTGAFDGSQAISTPERP
jgi:hypothetical protein